MKKTVGILLILMLTLQMLSVAVLAEDINTVPSVGVMEFKPCQEGTRAVGLRTDGTVNVYGVAREKSTEPFFAEIGAVSNAVGVACTENLAFVLTADGKVKMFMMTPYYYNAETYAVVEGWENIVAIECGKDHVVGLKTDGTLVAAGPNREGECDVEGFRNIVWMQAQHYYTLCLDKDGKVYTAGTVPFRFEVKDWTGIKDVSVAKHPAANMHILVAITSDGELKLLPEERNFNVRFGDEIVPVTDVPAKMGIGEIVDVQALNTDEFLFVDDKGDCYLYSFQRQEKPKKVAEDVHSVRTSTPYYYFALDNSGQIISSKATFQSEDWILTTNITLNGVKVACDVPPYVKDGRTLAPLRAILEALGMQVFWDDPTQTATAVKDDTVIQVTLGSNVATVNGVQKELDVPAEIRNDRTFVPVRFFAEALGMTVEWNSLAKTVVITQN